ncbi:MAG: molybdopterin-dependent oxidoreductase [Gordonibacter sp.]|uniref:molybdopterin-containing oxidoreductase family protein n=1 Tax=Gordonibacter sp. TaxID=1968902 RepID=UPI002FC5D01C
MQKNEVTVLNKPLGRRSFLKGSAAVAVAAGAGAFVAGCSPKTEEKPADLAPKTPEEAGEIVTPGVCRGGCGAGCQMNVHVRDGKIVKTSRREQSNPDTTRVCNRGLAHSLRVYAEDRLKYPMKRAGERGEGKWEQISWDEAVTTITDKWKEVAEKYGPGANGFLKSSGNISPDAHNCLMLRAYMGATLIDPACDRALYVAGPAAAGYSNRFCGSALEDVFNTKNLLIWGYNPTESTSHMTHYLLRAQQEHGTKLIVIDTTFTIIASKADMFVPIHPGTDGALALGMMNVLVSDGLTDEAFLAANTVAPLLVKEVDGTYLRLSDLSKAAAGTTEDLFVVCAADGSFGSVAEITSPAIHGKFTVEGTPVTTSYDLLLERVAEWTPEKASEICKVPVETIKELAHIMVDSPAAVAPGLGLDHYTNGTATYAAIFAMTMMAGQLGKPGTGFKGAFAAESALGWMPYGLVTPADAPKSNTFYAPAMLNCMDSGKYGDADINIKTLYIWNHNLFGGQVGNVKWREFLKDVELIVVADVVSNSTTDYADIVLPACHYFECESASGESTKYVFYNQKAAEPLYESKSDYDISCLFFEKMGLQDKNYDTLDKLFEAVFDNDVARAIDLTWDRVKKEGAVLTWPQENYVYGEDGVWVTPTGRLQFYQEAIPLDTNYGQTVDFVKERLPYWEPPIEGWRDNELAAKFPLVFTSERSKFKVHTQFTHVPWFLELEAEPYVMVNPADCEPRGIVDGDYVRVFNDRGTATLLVRFNDGIRPGMVVIDRGWEQDQHVAGFYSDLLSYNVTPVVANSYYFDTLVQMEKANS